jgi:broad specificity phosphatase PhoE
VGIRRGRATVTGSCEPGSQELARHEPFELRDARSRGGVTDGSGSGSVRRLLLVRHAPTAATRAYAFPADEALDDRAVAAAAELSIPARAEVVCSPSERCVATAEAAGLTVGAVEPAIAECDFGSWGGRTLDELVAERPGETRRWMADPDSAPHGGESLRAFAVRVAAWLDAQAGLTGTCVAITHGGVVKAAVVHALAAPIEAFWRVDCAPLSLTELHANRGRWTLRSVNVPARAMRNARTDDPVPA